MARGAEQARPAVSARKDRTGTKKQKEKTDTESSSDSDVERAAEAEAKRSREKDCKPQKNSVLGKGQHPAEVALWWILSEM